VIRCVVVQLVPNDLESVFCLYYQGLTLSDFPVAD
jgi:hypothetical protein